MSPRHSIIARRFRQGSRPISGALLVELACSALLFAFFAILAIHMGLVIYGAFHNDTACRDAARAAAEGSSQAQATQLAQTVLISYRQVNSYLTSPTLITPIVYQDFGGTPPNPQTSPYVQVTTSTTVNLPIPAISFFAAAFNADQHMTFKQTYTFPIVRVN
jgi:hypothetical protein